MFAKKRKTYLIGLSALILALAIIVGIFAFKTFSKYHNGYFVETLVSQDQSDPSEVWNYEG